MKKERLRALGIKIAKEAGLKITTKAIKYDCYEEIFKTAVKESGSINRVIDILTEIKNPELAYRFAKYIEGVGDLTKNQIAKILNVIVEAKNPEWAHDLACLLGNIGRLKEDQVDKLLKVTTEAKDPEMACFFACDVNNLTKNQIAEIFKAIISKRKNTSVKYLFSYCCSSLLTEEQKSALEKITR